MRTYILLAFILFGPVAFAQQANPLPTVQEKMESLKWLVGRWQGPVFITGEGGTKNEFKQTLEFSPRLKNSVMLLNESAVKGQDTVFQNIGFLGYDASKSKYNIKAFTNGGVQLEADVEVGDKKLIWRITMPGYTLRYTATLNQKGQWHQIGEGSMDGGNSWNPFFESTLTRVKK